LIDQAGPPEQPPWVKARITKAPKIREIYWCDFWRDAHMPEMWKTRPVVVVSYRNRLNWPCLVVPISTVPQDDNPWAHKVGELIEGVQGWAICNQPSTVAPSRFSTYGGKVPRMSDADFDAILGKLLTWLPKLPAGGGVNPPG
jgi:mRNA interferase MazF